MNRTFLLFALIFSVCFGCGKDAELSKVIDLDEFSILVPAGWNHTPQQGFDSKVGVISNGKDKLTYDYGWYSYNFHKQTSDTHTQINTTIEEKDALIVRPKKKRNGIIGVFIEVDDQVKFNLYGENIKDEETVLKIIHSVKFD